MYIINNSHFLSSVIFLNPFSYFKLGTCCRLKCKCLSTLHPSCQAEPYISVYRITEWLGLEGTSKII